MAELVNYLDLAGAKKLTDSAKAYSVKVSKITTNTVTNTDGSKTVTFTQNGANVGELVLDKEKYLKEFELVYASDPDTEPDPGEDDTRIEDPENPGTYLDEGNYFKNVVEGANDDGSDKITYVKADIGVNMEVIDNDSITDWFKDESAITLNNSVVVTTVNGNAPEAGQTYYTGDVLVLTAPTTNAESKALVAVTVNGTAITTNTTTGVADYTLSDYDYTVVIDATYEE